MAAGWSTAVDVSEVVDVVDVVGVADDAVGEAFGGKAHQSVHQATFWPATVMEKSSKLRYSLVSGSQQEVEVGLV